MNRFERSWDVTRLKHSLVAKLVAGLSLVAIVSMTLGSPVTFDESGIHFQWKFASIGGQEDEQGAVGESHKSLHGGQAVSTRMFGLHGQLGSPALWSPVPYTNQKTFDRKTRADWGFNVPLSDTISLDRRVPEGRNQECRSKFLHYPLDLPDTSVVIVFANEAQSILYRTIHSVLNTVQPHLLQEIILVDDCSDKLHLQKPLEDYIAILPKVKLIRLPQRSGLIQVNFALF